MVIVVFALDLEQMPEMVCSTESTDLRFFSREELKDIQIVVTHSDIVDAHFIQK